MSVVQAVVHATLSPSPSASPVAQAAQAAVQAHAAAAPASNLPNLSDMLNGLASALAPYIVVIGGVVAAAAQSLLNKLPWLSHDIAKVQDLRRVVLAVFLPLAGTFLAGLATGQNALGLAPWVFVASQILFAAVKALQASGAAAAPAASLAVEEPAVG